MRIYFLCIGHKIVNIIAAINKIYEDRPAEVSFNNLSYARHVYLIESTRSDWKKMHMSKNEPRIRVSAIIIRNEWLLRTLKRLMTSLIKYWFKFFSPLSSRTARVTDGFARYLQGMPCKYIGKHPKTRASVTWRCACALTHSIIAQHADRHLHYVNHRHRFYKELIFVTRRLIMCKKKIRERWFNVVSFKISGERLFTPVCVSQILTKKGIHLFPLQGFIIEGRERERFLS